MPGHDHYEELCALAAGGHLDSTEYVAFQAHVKECGECRTAYREMAAPVSYTHLYALQVPVCPAGMDRERRLLS